jgi:hypothetical protein
VIHTINQIDALVFYSRTTTSEDGLYLEPPYLSAKTVAAIVHKGWIERDPSDTERLVINRRYRISKKGEQLMAKLVEVTVSFEKDHAP